MVKTLGFKTTTKKLADETPVLIPQTAEEFDSFCETLITKYGLPDSDQTRCSIAEMICHMPKTQAFETLSYFANGVRRGIAHLVAYNKCEGFYKPIREAQKKKDEEEMEKAKLKLVENGDSPSDGQPIQVS